MTPHEQLMRDLAVERYATPVPEYTPSAEERAASLLRRDVIAAETYLRTVGRTA